MSGAVLDNLK